MHDHAALPGLLLDVSAQLPQEGLAVRAGLLEALRLEYPRDLRIEWGERLVGDRDRDALSGTVFGIVHGVPSTVDVSTGIDGDGRLTVEFDGAASPRAIADAILAAPSFRRLYIDGQPPTEVRVTHVKDISVTTE